MRTSLFFTFTGVALMLLTACAPTSQERTSTQPPSQVISFEETEFDFGVIKQSGGKVSHDFTFTHGGDTPIEIVGVPTSCACTSAVVDRTELQPGETGVLTVTLNPNLHEEPEGKFFKTVALFTEPALSPEPEVTIWAEVDLDLGPEAFELSGDHDEEPSSEASEGREENGGEAYQSVLPERFSQMLENKDFLLVDVHIPEQQHINGTDLFVPYDEVEERIGEFPKDKNAKIVLYCRSGGMSRAAAFVLSEHGYTNVIDLVGGKDAYDALSESQEISGEAQAQYIEVKAIVVDTANIDEINQAFNNPLLEDVALSSTTILLTLDNHRSSLAEYDYEDLSSLDGVDANEWLLLSSEMGGHHVVGLLTFTKQETPQTLTISGLPVGDVIIRLSPRVA